MSPRWFAVLLLLCAAHGTSAVAGDTPPAGDRRVLEGQISAILSSKTVVFPPLEPGGEVRTEVLPQASPTDGTVLSETSAFFEGCVLVVRLVHPRPIGGQMGWRQMDSRLDLSLIETDPKFVRIRPPSNQAPFGPRPSTVTYRWQADVEGRMEALQRLANDILEEAMARFPSDVATRLTWIAARHEEELVDKIYLNAGERTYYANGQEVSGPLSFLPIYLLDGQRAVLFVELMHRYQTGYCGERASTSALLHFEQVLDPTSGISGR